MGVSKGEVYKLEDDVQPDSDRCVQIATRFSVREMIAPGAYAILVPICIGFTVGPRCLMGTVAGAVVSGAMLAITMSNAGGAWDNAKKLCQKLRIKRSRYGKACVVADTVGDPLKDTSGPTLNILIKLVSMVSLTIAPFLKVEKQDGPTLISEGNMDWENWGWGMVPWSILVVITVGLTFKQILTWQDPLALDIGVFHGVSCTSSASDMHVRV